jgi:RNA polymerase sigma-70 factor (ECF subfamily)
MAQFTDAQLLENCQAGDAAAIETWISTHQQSVYRLALTILDEGSQDGIAEADEAVQDVFLAALRALHSYRAEAEMKTWLYAITLNICRGRLRKRRSRQRLQQALKGLLHLQRQMPPAIETIAMQHIQHSIIWDAVRRLPDNLRLAIVLRYYLSLPLAEIARIAGCTERTVQNWLHAAHEQLRTDLSEVEPCSN